MGASGAGAVPVEGVDGLLLLEYEGERMMNGDE
jgi:hypothetical protein